MDKYCGRETERGHYLMGVLQAILNALELFDGLVSEGKLARRKKR